MGLVAEIGMLACRGALEEASQYQEEIASLAERCRYSTATLVTAGMLLTCLLESGVEAK
jgi:hypothetical protein